MKFAVIETGGKQYLVAPGTTIMIEKLPDAGAEGTDVVFDKVLLIHDGKNLEIGTPYISGKKVEATIKTHGRAAKVTVIKYKAKSRYFKKRGHRQPFTKVVVK